VLVSVDQPALPKLRDQTRSGIAPPVLPLRGLKATETLIDREEVVLDGEERPAKQQTANPAAEVVGRGPAPARDLEILRAQPKKQLPLQEVVLELPFLPAHSHQLAAPQTLRGNHLLRRA
jgi:hypothetical protein